MKTKTILVGNASFDHELEKQFWLDMELTLKRQGWAILFHTMRNKPFGEHHMILPARLKHVNGYMGRLPSLEHKHYPLWLTNEIADLIIEWEHQRWSEFGYEMLIDGGLKKLAWHVDRLFQKVKPAICMTTNKIDHGCLLFKLAADHYGVEYRFIERSPFDSILCEKSGMFAESQLFDEIKTQTKISSPRRRTSGRAIFEHLQDNTEGFRKQRELNAIDKELLSSASQPLIFLPFDNVLWTGWAQKGHPQGDIDYPEEFRDPEQTIQFIADEVRKQGGTLVLKFHPSDNVFGELPSTSFPDNVIRLTGGLEEILNVVDGCIVFLSKVAFPAVCKNIPTAIVSTNTASILELGDKFRTKRQLRALIKQMCSEPGRREYSESQLNTAYDRIGWLNDEVYISKTKIFNPSRMNVLKFADDLVCSVETSEHPYPAKLGLDEWYKISASTKKVSLGFYDVH